MHLNSVSILIPTYNRARYLPECLHAVLAAARPQDEIIVINDGSTDKTSTILKAFGNRIRVLTTENRGKAAALNLGLEACAGDFVWIVDDDDIVLRDALSRLLPLFASHPETGIVYGRHNRFRDNANGKRELLGTGYWRYDVQPKEFLAETLQDFFVHQPGMLVRTDLYRQAGPFNEALDRSQDYEMLVRLARISRVAGTDEVVFLQRQHDGDRGRAENTICGQDRWNYWAKTDAEIFRTFHRTLPLTDFAIRPLSQNDPAATREALFRRGMILARHGNWHLGIRDFQNALEISQEPLRDSERTVLRAAVSAKYGCGELMEDPHIADELCRLSHLPQGDAVVRALAGSLHWRIRETLEDFNFSAAMRYGRLSLRMHLAGRDINRLWAPFLLREAP